MNHSDISFRDLQVVYLFLTPFKIVIGGVLFISGKNKLHYWRFGVRSFKNITYFFVILINIELK